MLTLARPGHHPREHLIRRLPASCVWGLVVAWW